MGERLKPATTNRIGDSGNVASAAGEGAQQFGGEQNGPERRDARDGQRQVQTSARTCVSVCAQLGRSHSVASVVSLAAAAAAAIEQQA